MSDERATTIGPPWRRSMRGTLTEHVVDSRVLRDNPLGDPSVRPLWVYSPPETGRPARQLPTIYVLQGYSNQVDMWSNRSSFRPTVIERVDALFSDETVPPCHVAFVDCWTSLGGSQFVDSPAIGRYHTYLCEEVVPFVDANVATLAARDHRAVTGHSSGGYGAMVSAMLRPDVFGGFATHAGDALFEASLWRDVPVVVRTLRDHYDGSFQRFLETLPTRPNLDGPNDFVLLMMWGLAAAYSSDADGTVRLPFDESSGMVVADVWERWLARDPVRMVAGHVDALRSMRAIYIDAGTSDDYFLDLGAIAFRDALAGAGITDVYFELFPGRHGGIDHRYPLALRYLAERISAAR